MSEKDEINKRNYITREELYSALEEQRVRTIKDWADIQSRVEQHKVDMQGLKQEMLSYDQEKRGWMGLLFTGVTIVISIIAISVTAAGYFAVKWVEEEKFAIKTDAQKSFSKTRETQEEQFNSFIDDYRNRLTKKIEELDMIRKQKTDYEKEFIQMRTEEEVLRRIEKKPESERTADDFFRLAFFYDEDIEAQIELYKKAIGKNPEFAEAYINRGNLFCKKKDYESAIKDYNKAAELNPIDPIIFNNRGVVFDAMHNYDQAVSDFSKAIDLRIDYAEAYINRGLSYKKGGEYNRAIMDFNEAISIQHENAAAYYNIACTYALKSGAVGRDVDEDADMDQDAKKIYKKEALKWLNDAANKGFDDFENAKNDVDLTEIRDNPEFTEIMKKIEKNAEMIK